MWLFFFIHSGKSKWCVTSIHLHKITDYLEMNYLFFTTFYTTCDVNCEQWAHFSWSYLFWRCDFSQHYWIGCVDCLAHSIFGRCSDQLRFAVSFFQRQRKKNQAKMPKEENKADEKKIRKMIEKNLLLITVLSGVVIGVILGMQQLIDKIRIATLQ